MCVAGFIFFRFVPETVGKVVFREHRAAVGNLLRKQDCDRLFHDRFFHDRRHVGMHFLFFRSGRNRRLCHSGPRRDLIFRERGDLLRNRCNLPGRCGRRNFLRLYRLCDPDRRFKLLPVFRTAEHQQRYGQTGRRSHRACCETSQQNTAVTTGQPLTDALPDIRSRFGHSFEPIPEDLVELISFHYIIFLSFPAKGFSHD